MTRLVLVGLIAVALALAVVGFAQAETHVVTVRNFADLANLTITEGDVVRWEWESGGHTVTSGTGPSDPNAGELFNAPMNSSNQVFEFTFDEPGTFPYYCIPHFASGMTASVTVEEETPVEAITWGKIKRLFEATSPTGRGN